MATLPRGKLVIAGAGGFGIEALWVAEAMNLAETAAWEILGFVDDNPDARGSIVAGAHVLGTPDEVAKTLKGEVFFHPAIGRNRSREKVAARLESHGWKPATLIHPSVVGAPGVIVGRGCYVGAAAILAPLAVLGDYVLVNCSAGIGHHAELGNYSQVCPGARVNGACKIDKYGFIGSNASLNPGIRVGEAATVGSNSVAIRNVEPLVTVLGVPARIISRPAASESPA